MFVEETRGGEANRRGVEVPTDEPAAGEVSGDRRGARAEHRVDEELAGIGERVDETGHEPEGQRVVVAQEPGPVGAAVLVPPVEGVVGAGRRLGQVRRGVEDPLGVGAAARGT